MYLTDLQHQPEPDPTLTVHPQSLFLKSQQVLFPLTLTLIFCKANPLCSQSLLAMSGCHSVILDKFSRTENWVLWLCWDCSLEQLSPSPLPGRSGHWLSFAAWFPRNCHLTHKTPTFFVFCAQVEDMFGITVSRPLRQAFLHGGCLGVAKKEPGFIDSQVAAQATRVNVKENVR